MIFRGADRDRATIQTEEVRLTTKPPKDLYDPSHTVALAYPVTSKAHPVLCEIINQGAAILARCEKSVDDSGEAHPPDTHLAVFTALHQLLEALDAANELLRSGRAAGSHPALRSAFEAILTIEFILESRATYRQRAFAYLHAAQRDKIRIWEQHVSGTHARKEFEKAFRRDTSMSSGAPPKYPNAPAAVKRQRALLLKAGWKEAVAEWKRMKKADNRAPEWFRLYNGPRSLLELSERVGRSFQYEILYRKWSRTAHAQDLGRVLGAKDGGPAYSMIPDVRGIDTAFFLAMSFGIGANRTVLKFFRGEEKFFSDWYKREVADIFIALSRGKLRVA